MWDLLFESISRRGVELSSDDQDVIRSLFVHKKFRKHQYLLQAGDISTHDNFIIKGLCRTYQVDEKDTEHILRFTPEGWWTGDLASFLENVPSVNNIDCLEDTEVLRISRRDLEILFDRVPAMNKYFRLLYQRSIISYARRLQSNISKPAAARYDEFLIQYPHIDQRVPDHMIASYLGITPQSLSRIRSQAAKRR